MAYPQHTSTEDTLKQHLAEVVSLLEKQKLEEAVVRQRHSPRNTPLIKTLLQKRYRYTLKAKLELLHAADIAYILEALPLEQRLAVWELVKSEVDGQVLLDVSDAVRETLISDMDTDELLSATEQLETDEIAYLAPDLPEEVMHELLESLNDQGRARLRSVLSHDENSVAALMDFSMVTIRNDITLGVVLRYLRRRADLPEHTDKLFVVDHQSTLQGVLPLKSLLVNQPDRLVAEIMSREFISFQLGDDASDAARAFERYDLLSAPVVDEQGKLQGCVRVEEIIDHIRQESSDEMLTQAGLLEEEDLFSSVWKSLKNRSFWLGINLITAFVSTRVIGLFEDTIEHIVALASLMPIVAGIGGNTGTQTSTLIIRSLALDLITPSNIRKLILKELGVATFNGLLWGSLVGLVAYAIYRNVDLGIVMGAAMFCNLLVAAFLGLSIPLIRNHLNLDPAIGTSVLLTAITDSMGFFIFLALATLFMM